MEVAAGELFRSVADPRISKCADHSPMPSASLTEIVEAGAAWVVAHEAVAVGFVVARVVDGAAHVEELAVDPAHGRRGHATSLLEVVEAWALDRGLSGVTLTTFRDVPWNRPFYERRAFRVLGEGELSEALLELRAEEEEQYGLLRELRVVMRRELVRSA